MVSTQVIGEQEADACSSYERACRAARLMVARAHAGAHGRLPAWTIYLPRIGDGRLMARLIWRRPQLQLSEILLLGDTMDELRGLLPPGLVRLTFPLDTSHRALETWVDPAG